MTWLELMDVLDRMPRHLLKDNVELWHYDNDGNYEILPVDEIVSPISDGGSDEDWGPDGDHYLSLQSFDEERKPKLQEYVVSIHRVCNVSVMAECEEQAKEIGENLAGGYTRFACDTINETMAVCNDKFAGIMPNDEYCDLTLNAEDSMKALSDKE